MTPISDFNEEENGQLRPGEEWWRDHYELFRKWGYQLRPRYQPGWIPSWKTTGKSPLFCEDYIFSARDNLLDATRIKDGSTVTIKRIDRKSRELAIALFLSPNEEDEADPENHCVPIVDHFSDDCLPQFTFLVMPLLRPFDDPPFYSVDETLDFIQQTLEGLSHMHRRGVAHRDCSDLNIMLDGSLLYPRGYHPAARVMDPTGRKLAPFRRRRDVKHVRYFFIDFGISTRFGEDVKAADRLVTGINGQDREVPELSNYLPYNPFAVDVFILGNLYRRNLVDQYANLAFLSGLVASMTALLPEDRPTVDSALTQFNELVAAQSSVRLRWRLKQKDAGLTRSVFEDIGSLARESLYLSRKIISYPLALLRR